MSIKIPHHHTNRNYWAAILGNVLEHYDQALYGFLVPFLAPIFFPHSDPVYSLIFAYALLPITFFSKFLGAYIFGRFGDRWGRKFTLSLTLQGMALSTAAIGFIPSYEHIGWLAPTLLTISRLFQNFFASGEITGAALFILEKTPQTKRGFMSSLFDASGIAGILLAASLAAIFGESHWRILFLIGGLTGLLGLVFRKGISENTPHNPTRWHWNSGDWKPVLAIAVVSGFSYANYYLLSTFLNGFLPLVSDLSTKDALSLNSWLLVADFFLLPLFGWLSLRTGKSTLMLIAAITAAVLAYPLFTLLQGADMWIAGGVRMSLLMIGVCLAAPYHAWAMEIAPKERRFTVCAIGSAIGSRIIGAPIPALSLWIFHETGWTAGPAIPLILTASAAAGTLAYLRRHQEEHKPLQIKTL